MNTLFQLISHEYRKYVFTRGFLLFLLILPATAAFGIFAVVISDRAAPIRSFALVDETGQYAAVIDRALADRMIDDEIQLFDAWAYVAVRPAEDGSAPLEFPYRPGDDSDARRSAFSDQGGLAAAIAAARPYVRDEAPDPPVLRPSFERVNVPPAARKATGEETVQALLPYLSGDELLDHNGQPLFAVVFIPEDFAEGAGEVQFWTNNLVDEDLRWFIDRTLTDAVRSTAYEAAGVTRTEIRRIENIDVAVTQFKAGSEGDGRVGIAERAQTFIPLGLAYALLLMITTVGGMLLTSTVEEKSNKIVEVLLSSVSATQLMVGKLVGLALVGMTLPALALLGGFAALHLLLDGVAAEAIRSTLFGSPLVPLFFFYFIAAYLFYASIYLAVGALSASIQDAQSFVGPLTIMLFLPFPFLRLIVEDPNGIVARIFTWIPIYTPYAIMIRISADPPQWELIAATALFVAVVVYVVGTMGRIYRNGVLSSGGAPTLKQIRSLAKQRA
ncbi:ABC transporter permease [Parvularcula sp. LCG005]|uniref:ABC transporter permease n=1 Tax=Parvularcula sp. LCG005 TaxID=3078805 RepID=UPI0029420BB9|nr:ABC transporter permease [Parvularcula sp. LCG005]WOI54786.1 ABC transporter permease [Parvularcula sp. LCG005]